MRKRERWGYDRTCDVFVVDGIVKEVNARVIDTGGAFTTRGVR